MDLSRSEKLLGKQSTQVLSGAHVTIVGCGGVGGYVAHMLTRMGVCHLTLVDSDVVTPSNINRQVVALANTIGLKKVGVLKKQLEEINPDVKVDVYAERLSEENVNLLIQKCDYVVDAIDSVKDKVALIVYCKQNGIKIVSAMGAGNRYKIPHFVLTDIYKTHDDGLAKVIRKALRQSGIDSLDVVTCDEKAVKSDGVVGSVSYYPAMCGIVIASVVINKLLEGEK